MKGRTQFTKVEARKIRDLLRQKVKSGNEMRFRVALREIGFYISDFARRRDGFSPSDFDEFVASGAIRLGD
jgi:hypothetical protein